MAEKKTRLNLSGMSFKQAIAAVNKEYGANTMVLGSEARGMKVEFFSWGVDALDFATGGGIPKNRVISIIGPYSALKTTIAYKSIVEFQKEDKNNVAVLIDIEHSHDQAYADLLGIDSERLAIVNPDSGEQAVDVLHDLTTYDNNLYAVVDSIAMITPTAEIESSADQQYMGGNARLINKMMRVLIARMKRSLYDKDAPTTTVLCVNQIREKIGVMFGSPETAPGGRGKEYAFSLAVTVRSGVSDKIMEKKTVNGVTREIRVGQRVRYAVTKNKVSGSQFDEGEFEYFVKPNSQGIPPFTINNMDILIKFGLFYNLIKISYEKQGKKEVEKRSYGDIEKCGVRTFAEKLADDSDIQHDLRIDILDAIREENIGIMKEVKKKKGIILKRK